MMRWCDERSNWRIGTAVTDANTMVRLQRSCVGEGGNKCYVKMC